MQPTYFHVDRLNRLIEGQKIQVLYTAQELAKFKTNRADMMSDLFPQGLSYHGQRYLIDQRKTPDKDIDGQVEVLAEFMRRTRFPKRPCRYQSFFACRTLEDALRFRQEYGGSISDKTERQTSIWEVETKRPVFEGDLRHLTHWECWSDCFVRLDWYWRQVLSDNPLIEVLMPLPVRILRRVA